MMEYEDVLTNQPVVIDNVYLSAKYSWLPLSRNFVNSMLVLLFRVQELLKLVSLVMIFQNVISHPSKLIYMSKRERTIFCRSSLLFILNLFFN